MKQLIWKAQPEAKHFIVPFPVSEDEPMHDIVNYMYSDQYAMQQIELIDPKTHEPTLFNILDFIGKYPVDKVSNSIARLCAGKAYDQDGNRLTGDYLVEQLKLKNDEFKNTTHIVFFELVPIETNEQTQE